MDSESLRTASEYLNNLLLARGLLRDGQPVDFVRPSKESRAQIINLVHDLVLRNDRDKDAREQTAFSYRQLRAEEDQKTHEIERLQLKYEESARATIQAETAERVAKEGVKKLEKSIRTLQDQNNKVKTALNQVKAQCTNDVRKRDLELARLKGHLQDQQRGTTRSAMVAPSITISGGRSRPTFNASVRDVADPAYSLRQETNEFLTQLSSTLSDENDRLISIVRETVDTIREQLGLHPALRGAADSGIGDEAIDTKQRDKLMESLPTNIDSLTSELEFTMNHLKALLTNPSFVSIEEVEVREEELARMRADWEKMEQRWRDLLSIMHGWHRRMDTGGYIDIEDLRKGIGLVSPGQTGNGLAPRASDSGECSLVDDSVSDLHNGTTGKPDHACKAMEPSRKDHATQSSRIPKANTANRRLDTRRVSPKRKRDPLEPPECFDLRPRSNDGKTAAASLASRRLDELDDEESEELEVPRMTIEEKLSAAAEEAAAVRGETHNGTTGPRAFSMSMDGSADKESLRHGDTLGKLSTSSNKKIRIRGKPKRRTSTLSRDELAELLIDAD